MKHAEVIEQRTHTLRGTEVFYNLYVGKAEIVEISKSEAKDLYEILKKILEPKTDNNHE